MSDQLRVDLRRQIYKKLNQWIIDSVDLYNMVELDEQVALQDVLTMMTSMSAMIVSSSEMSLGEYARVHVEALKHLREHPQAMEGVGQ
jgi:hypothetical protein